MVSSGGGGGGVGGDRGEASPPKNLTLILSVIISQEITK